MKYKICFLTSCLLFLGTAAIAAGDTQESIKDFTLADIPTVKLEGDKIDISAYQFLGSWSFDSKSGQSDFWRNAIKTDLANNARTISLSTIETPLPGASPRQLTTESDPEFFKTISWRKEQISVLDFCAVAIAPQTAILEFDVDTPIAIYNNGKFLKEVNP